MDTFIGEDLLGEISYCSMWDGIVDMQQVQFFIFDHIDQLTGERGIIRRIVKERILLGIDLMEKNIFLVMGQADGPLVGDKVDLMPFGCQGKAQFCGDDTTTSVGRVTNYSYTHPSIILDRCTLVIMIGMHGENNIWLVSVVETCANKNNTVY